MSVANPIKQHICKLATEAVQTHGQETRRKKPIRGFYTDPSPGFFDLKGKFEAAARTNPESKIAEALMVREVLDLFGFHGVKRAAESKADPVDALLEVFKNYDFGFTNGGKTTSSSKKDKNSTGLKGSDVEATSDVGWEW